MDKFSWANQTEVHPYGLSALVILALVVILLPRRYKPIPILIMACLIPSRQRIVILELDWTYLRLLILAAWMGVFARSEFKGFRTIPLDRWVVALVVLTGLTATLRTLSPDVLIRHLGVMFDIVGAYMLFRLCIRGWPDVIMILKTLIVLSIPVTIAMTLENQTGYNVFHVFGGVPEFTLVREGRIRAQAAFAHPILAGCFWASLLPLVLALALSKKVSILWSIVGTTTFMACIYFSASSTPVLGALAAMIGCAFYILRRHMRIIRWGLLATLITLHIVMKAPVWHLISRIDAVGGSTGWQRYILIDRSIKRFGEWFLLGIDQTRSWGHGMGDITNQYLVRGFQGGFLALCIFLVIIALSFQAAGRIWKFDQPNRARMVLGWALGASLFTHTMMFMAVSYFGQITILWWLLIAILGSLSLRKKPRRSRSGAAARPIEENRVEPPPRPVTTPAPATSASLGKDLLDPR